MEQTDVLKINGNDDDDQMINHLIPHQPHGGLVHDDTSMFHPFSNKLFIAKNRKFDLNPNCLN